MRPPRWLWIYAIVSVLESIVGIVLRWQHPLAALSLVFAILFAWLLLRGGRVIWCLAVLGEVLVLVGVAWGQPVWKAAIAPVQLALLLAPSSRRYVWEEARLRRSLAAADGESYGIVARVASGVLWEEMWTWIGDHAVNWKFIGRLFVAILLASVVSAALRADRHDSLFVAVPYRVAHMVGVLGIPLLLALLIAIGVRALVRRFSRGPGGLPRRRVSGGAGT